MAICALMLLSGLLFWLFLKNIFFTGSGGLEIAFDSFYFFLDLLFFASFYCLSFLLFKDWKRIVIICCLGIAPIFFIIPVNLIIIFALLIFLLMALLGLRSIRNEQSDRLSVDIHAIAYQGITYILTGVFIVIASFYYVSPALDIAAIDISIPRPVLERAAIFAQSFLAEQGITPKEKIVIPENLFDYINSQLKNFTANFKNQITFVFAIGLFMALRTFNFLIAPMVAFITSLILKIFMYFKMILIKNEEVTAKRIVINF